MAVTPIFADPSSSVEDRVEDLFSRMEIDEKLAQLGAVFFPHLLKGDRFDPDTALAAIPHGIGQVTRIGATTGLHPAQTAELVNEIQRLVIERTRLGIPVIVHEESLAGYCARDATVFPQSLGLACTWDPQLIEEVASVIRRQLLAVGARHSLAPVLDVARDPRWGRLEETYGEDPVLVGTLGAAYVRGMQTGDLSQGVLATGKHFLAHGLSEGGRNHAPVQVGPRELREVFAEPFAAAIRESGLATIMSSYSCVDGLPGSGSREILTDLLRDELGFEGMVVADYFAVSLLATYHRVAKDRAEAAAKAICAGLDMELPALDCFGEPLKAAIASGRVPMEVVDTAVRRVLAAKVRLGLFESPYVDLGRVKAVFSDKASVALARRAASRGIVLLANDGTLPLRLDLSAVAVIGPGANDRRLLQGDYHYPAHQEVLLDRDAVAADPGLATDGEDHVVATAPPETSELIFLPSGPGTFRPGPYFTNHVTPLAGIRAALGPKAVVLCEEGCGLEDGDGDDDQRGFGPAIEAASKSEVAVVVVGGRSGLQRGATVGEARDATDLRLTGSQEQLVAAVAKTGTPTVVVVMSGRAHVLSGIADKVAALLVAWPLGEQGGHALADVLFGKSEPTGRLPVSLLRSTGQVPLYYSHRSDGAKSMFYGDYTDCAHTALFPFGHGLSYTTFEQKDLVVTATDTCSPIVASVEVANTGWRPGEEVVQLYATDLVASVARPQLQLLGFARVTLQPQCTRQVTFRVHPSRLAFYDENMDFVVEPGEFQFATGASSGDLRTKVTAQLTGPIAHYSQRSIVAVSSTIGEPLPKR
jgi:beta-glucosidase